MRLKNLARVYAFLVLLSGLMIVTAVLGGHGGISSGGKLFPPELTVDRIAYVGLDGQIRTIKPDGSGEVRISPGEGVYTWPTWSPDGLSVVFSGFRSDAENPLKPRVSLLSHNTLSKGLRELHVRPTGVSSLIAPFTPHYPYWSPNGRCLAFIGNTVDGLTLYLVDMADMTPAVPTLDKGPLWLDWSPDSRYLLVHRADEILLIDAQQGTTERLGVESDAISYRVPAWRPPGTRFTFVSGDMAGGYALYTSGLDDLDPTLVDQIPPNTAFLWSPNGNYLAVTRSQPNIVFFDRRVLSVYDRVTFYLGDGSRLPLEIRDNVLAFFWSPNSSKLAYVTLSDLGGPLRWNILDIAQGESWPLADFFPSEDQVTLFQYFYQYAHSHLIWSPRSDALVFSGQIAGTAVSVSYQQQQNPQIFVLSADKLRSALRIGDGYLGFWSPR